MHLGGVPQLGEVLEQCPRRRWVDVHPVDEVASDPVELAALTRV
jgi:hypothetical protein